MSRLRVYLVDDHPIVRNGLKALVSGQPDMELVGEAVDGACVLKDVPERQPDVVVMDLSMPKMNGFEVARHIRACAPNVRVVVLTAHEDRGYVMRALEAGASAYVLKRTAPTDLLGAIRHAMSGHTYLDPVAGQFVSEKGATATSESRPALSCREESVLKEIARGYSNKQIAARLKLSVKTVETYKKRAMDKVGAKSRVDLVRYAAEHGWFSGP